MSNEVVTHRVVGRRTVRYESFQELLAEAERLAAVPTRTLGNWSVGQIYHHIAMALDTLIDGAPFSAPVPIQWILRIFMKKRMLTRTLDPGFKLPKQAARLIPVEISTEEGLAHLRKAVQRILGTSQRARHPAFGNIPPAESDAFQLRHAEMHMSFILPTERPTAG